MDKPSEKAESALRAVHQGLFPTLDTLASAVDLAMSQLPIETPNQLYGLLMVYHNTLLKTQETKPDRDSHVSDPNDVQPS